MGLLLERDIIRQQPRARHHRTWGMSGSLSAKGGEEQKSCIPTEVSYKK